MGTLQLCTGAPIIGVPLGSREFHVGPRYPYKNVNNFQSIVVK
jgi:hypothetical protein